MGWIDNVSSLLTKSTYVPHLGVKPLDDYTALLAHPPAAPDGLFLQSRVEAGLHDEDVGGRGQVDAH